jgi:hypothetical protein
VRSLIACLTTITSLAMLIAAANGQDCKCLGTSKASYTGGAGDPLKWIFEAYLIRPGSQDRPALLCYHKNVTNDQDQDVRNINWQVASYFRYIIPKKRSSPSCPTIPGEMNPEINGPLYYGVTKQAYDTTVRQPKDGWNGKAELQREFPPLHSQFVIQVATTKLEANEIRYGTARIDLTSLVELSYDATFPPGNRVYMLTYRIENNGDWPIGISANLPATPTMLKDVLIISSRIFVPPGKFASYTTSTSGPVLARTATLAFMSAEDNQTAAIESAGFYVPADGKKLRSDEDFWKSIQ